MGSIPTILTEVYCDFLVFTLKGHNPAPALRMYMSLHVPLKAKNLLTKKRQASEEGV